MNISLKRIVTASTCIILLVATGATGATGASAQLEEHVAGGTLDLSWVAGFGLTNSMTPVTLLASDPAFGNPSGDHTVGSVVNAAPGLGGIAKSCVDPGGISDYEWEAFVFLGAGDTRRGIVVRADPTNGFASCYQLLIEQGLLQLKFRKLIAGVPTELGNWLTTSLPGGFPSTNTWHHMKIIAMGNSFRCFWDGFEITTSPIIDGDLTSGWAGVYNFRFDIGGIAFLVDDLILTPLTVPVAEKTWGEIKALYME